MAVSLSKPNNVKAEPRDCSVYVSWEKTDGADGYIISFFRADAPDKCIKKRYAQGSGKLLLGFENGTEYLVSVRAFYRDDNNTERKGEASAKVSFVPFCAALKAQKVICLPSGGIGQIKWQLNNKTPMAHFESSDNSVATVGSGGMIHAVSAGSADITVSAEGQKFKVRVYVDRAHTSADANAVLMFTGDLMCAAAQQRKAAQRGFEFGDSFDRVRGLLSSADLCVGVLETVCCDGAPYEYEQLRLECGAPNCNSPSEFVRAAANAGFDVMVTANNHNCDAGYTGLEQTVSAVKHAGMANLGTLGDDIIIRDVNGIRAAIIACTAISNGQDKTDDRLCAQPSLWGKYTPERFAQLCAQAKKQGAEYIAAYIHWGVMNSRAIVSAQTQAAQHMADCGADLIIGSHPHVLQELRYITASDGRVVACMYSLGNFLSSQAELTENRDSVILRAELTKGSHGVTADISCIPCHCFDTYCGAGVFPVNNPYSDDSQSAVGRIRECVGKRAQFCAKKPKAVLSGSVILERIFSEENGFFADKTPVLLSQLTACSGKGERCDIGGTITLDVEKSFASYIKSCGADFIAVDFYAAAAISCYRLDGVLYTGSKKFLDSRFYKRNKNKFVRIKPPFPEKLWKPCVEKYAKAVMAAFSPDRIILFRQRFSEKSVIGGELRITVQRDALNKRIREMEDYFISLVRPAVVDISRCYFSAGASPADIEREYYTDASNAAMSVLKQGRRYIDTPDLSLWYDRVLRYYDSMTARGFQRWLLNMHSAADLIIAYTNERFAARWRDRLIRLKEFGRTELSAVRLFFGNDSGAAELVEAAELIGAVLSGDLTRGYDFYAAAFRQKFNIVKIIAKLLSAELKAPVAADSAELVFLLRERPHQLKQYLTKLRNITVDVWGSPLSKRIMDHCADARVGKYIFGQCPLLANEPLVPIKVPRDDAKFSGSSWRRQMTEQAFGRMGMFTLSASSSKWLVVDFYDTVNRMSELGGALFTTDEFLLNTEFYKDIKAQCNSCYLFEKRAVTQCQNALKRFAEDLSYRYGKNIILVKADIKDSYISREDRLAAFGEDRYLAVKRKLIALCEHYFAEQTGCFVLDIAKHYHASDRHPEGAGGVNYEEEFYRRAAEYISYVVNGGTARLLNRPDESYTMLRDLRLTRR